MLGAHPGRSAPPIEPQAAPLAPSAHAHPAPPLPLTRSSRGSSLEDRRLGARTLGDDSRNGTRRQPRFRIMEDLRVPRLPAARHTHPAHPQLSRKPRLYGSLLFAVGDPECRSSCVLGSSFLPANEWGDCCVGDTKEAEMSHMALVLRRLAASGSSRTFLI